MEKFNLGGIDFSTSPEGTTPDSEIPVDEHSTSWTDQELDVLFREGFTERTYYPAEFGRDIKIGRLYKLSTPSGQAMLAEVEKIDIVHSSEGYEGLKIRFKKLGD